MRVSLMGMTAVLATVASATIAQGATLHSSALSLASPNGMACTITNTTTKTKTVDIQFVDGDGGTFGPGPQTLNPGASATLEGFLSDPTLVACKFIVSGGKNGYRANFCKVTNVANFNVYELCLPAN